MPIEVPAGGEADAGEANIGVADGEADPDDDGLPEE